MNVQYLNKNCPICGGYIMIPEPGYEICASCGYTLPGATTAQTESNALENIDVLIINGYKYVKEK